jgi:branched-chain amino acid aminotransferase
VSEAAPSIEAAAARTPTAFRVRPATHADAPALAVAVCSLLVELGADPSPQPTLQQAARALLQDEKASAVLVADAEGAIVGFLGASWQSALRIPGRYGLIQELWVHPDWRSRMVGRALLSALCEQARERGVARIEVGLPGARFAGVAATETFYETNGFAAIGTRMRRLL